MIKYHFSIDTNFMKKLLFFIILMLGQFSVSAEGVDLNCSLSKPLCDNCPEYQTLFPLEQFSESSGTLDIEADESEILEEKYLLSGNVEVNSESLFLSANDVEVTSTDSSLLATGNVKFQDKSFLIKSNFLSASRKDDELIATATNANYQDYSVGLGGANGFTEVIEKTPTSVLLTNSTYSLCPVNQNDWQIDADEIELNLEKNRGYADNATIKFYGIPIFYTPKHSWVLAGRGSGFLTPDYSRYNEADETKRHNSIRVPYYFNLAPDQDLLVALKHMSSRGLIYESTYRKLIAKKITPEDDDSILSIETKYLPKDKLTNLKRWLINFSQEMDITNQTHLSVKLNRVSDSKYFEEIARTNTDETSLISTLEVTHKNTEKNLNVSLLSENEQIVNEGAPAYTRSLEAFVSKTFNKDSKTPIKAKIISTKFAHDAPTKETGTRNHVDLKISRQLNTQYPKITPFISSTITSYSLNNSSNTSRTILGSGLDFDFTLSSMSSLFGHKVNHIISPKVSYTYRQKKDQSHIPIFDTKDRFDSLITFKDLTSGERYNGLDRISNANDITLSLESSYRDINGFDDEKKKDLLNLKIAQSFYKDKEVVSDELNTNYETRKSYSDIALSIDLSVDNFSFSSAGQFSPDKSKFLQTENIISYSPADRKFIALSFLDEENKQINKIHGAYPLSESLHFFGGIDKTKSKVSSENTESETSGITYESCCWAFRIAHFKEDNSSDGFNYSTGMELVFKGLGSTSSPLKGKIEGKIPEYLAKLR
jgi:LPS-assembly protein